MAALKAIPQNQFQNCFEGQKYADIGVQLPKGSTLKANTVVFSNDVCSTFTAMSLRTLLSAYVLKYSMFYRQRFSEINSCFMVWVILSVVCVQSKLVTDYPIDTTL